VNILILFKKWNGGVGTVVKHLSNEFQKNGHKVIILSREDDLNKKSLFSSIFLLRKKIKEIVRKEKIDIIYTQDWSLAFPLLAPIPMLRDRHFCVFYGISDTFLSVMMQKIIGRIMGGNIIVCTNSLKKMFPKSNLIYNRVNSKFFKPKKKIKKIKNSVGFAGWKIPAYHFEEIKTGIEKAGKKMIIAENIPKEKMPEFYNKIESFISLPPECSGFGLVYLEAMASGVPKIIGSNYGGGDVIPITKIEDYNGNISEAIKNSKSKNYRKWILENKFTWEDAALKLEKIFENKKS